MNERREAARLLLSQGLTVVPYTSPYGHSAKPGKAPLCYWEGERKGRRVECFSLDDFDPWLRRVPTLNIAVMTVIQVDADSPEAVVQAAELGVRSTGRVWIIRTRRGWRAIYRPPARFALQNCVKAGGVDLDLLINSPALVPPSVHPSGVHYLWVDGHTPKDIPFHDLDEPPTLLQDWWGNLVRPVRTTPVREELHIGDMVSALREAVESRQLRGSLASPNSDGWQSGNCVFPENHKHGDRGRSFSINFQRGGWLCYGGCGKGTLNALAERLGISAPIVQRGRRQSIRSVMVADEPPGGHA